MADGRLQVEVAYATPERQWLIPLAVAPGTTAQEAIRMSGLPEACPGLDASRIGIFGEHVDAGCVLCDGDRVEVLRPLTADPREARRALAARGRSMKRR